MHLIILKGKPLVRMTHNLFFVFMGLFELFIVYIMELCVAFIEDFIHVFIFHLFKKLNIDPALFIVDISLPFSF